MSSAIGLSPKVRFKFFFPPLVFPYSPYLAPPLLKAYLQQHGHQVDQEDLNIGFFDTYLSAAGMRAVTRALEAEINADRIRESFPLDKAYSFNAKLLGLAQARYAERHVTEAVSILRDRTRFHNGQDYRWAMETISLALKALSAQYFPSEFTTEGFRTHCSPFVPSDIWTFARTVKNNPFVDHYQRTGLPTTDWSHYSSVGISVAFPDQVLAAFTLARMIKALAPDIVICCGGNYFSRIKDCLLAAPELFDFVDAVVTGEGEIPLLGIATALAEHRPLDAVPGLTIRRNGEVKRTQAATPLRAGDLPTPDFGGLPLDRYLSPELVLPLLTFKGCSYGKCTFCDHHVNYQKLSARPGEKVVEDVRILAARHNTRLFNFVDEEMPPLHARRVASALKAANLPEIRWMGYAIYRPEWSAEHWRELHDSGCREMLFGFESASERVLTMMKKPLSLTDVRAITATLNRIGIASRINVIVGFPGETEKEAAETRDFFLNSPELFDVPGTMVAFHPFLLVRNAPLALSPIGQTIAREDKLKNGFGLHFSYDVDRLPKDAGDPINSQQAYELAKRFSENISGSYTGSFYPVTRLHRFSYICANDRGPLIRERATGNQLEAHRELKPLHTEVFHAPFALEETAHLLEGVPAVADTYEFWMNFESAHSRISSLLMEEQQHQTVPKANELYLWHAGRDISGQVVTFVERL